MAREVRNKKSVQHFCFFRELVTFPNGQYTFYTDPINLNQSSVFHI
jgi:hypothetical protein